MLAVLFEVRVDPAHRDDYLDTAAALRELLADVDGFISIERFESLVNPGKLLSLSYWRDEAALAAWRNVEAHRRAQAAGRDGIFEDYSLRVAEVIRDYGMHDRDGAPEDSKRRHDAQTKDSGG